MKWTIKLTQIPIQNLENNCDKNSPYSNQRNQLKQLYKNNFYQSDKKPQSQYFNTNPSMSLLVINQQIFERNKRLSYSKSFSVRNRKSERIKQINQFYYLEYLFYRRKCLTFNKIKQMIQFANDSFSKSFSQNQLTLVVEEIQNAIQQLNMFVKLKNQISMVKAFILMKTITQMNIDPKHRIQKQHIIFQLHYPQRHGLLKLSNIIKKFQLQKYRNVMQFLLEIRYKSRIKQNYLKRIFEIIFLNKCSDIFKLIKYYNNQEIKKNFQNLAKLFFKYWFLILNSFFHKIQTIKMLDKEHSILSSLQIPLVTQKSNQSIHQIKQTLSINKHHQNVKVQVMVKQKEIKKIKEIIIPVEVQVQIKKMNYKKQNLQIYKRIYRNLRLIQISNKKNQQKKSNIKEYRVNFN